MPRPARSRPLVIAHRGSAATAPENTMAAFRAARRAGAPMIELDIRMSADGEFVVHHDLRLGRVMSGRGRVRDLSCGELRAPGVAVKFRGKRERIPLLTEVLAWLPGRLWLDIEVKTDGDASRRELYRRRLDEVLRQSGKRDRVVVTSFDHRFLHLLHRRRARYRRGVLFRPGTGRKVGPWALARGVGAAVFVCSCAQLTRGRVTDAHAHALAVWCYGVNSAADLMRARRFAADGIITDDPALMRDLLSSKGPVS